MDFMNYNGGLTEYIILTVKELEFCDQGPLLLEKLLNFDPYILTTDIS